MRIIYNPQQTIPKYAIYCLKDGETVIFYGFSKFVDILKIKDALQYPSFDANKDYLLEVLSLHPTYNEVKIAHMLLVSKKPPTPINSTIGLNNGRVLTIKCETTGQIFTNQADACRYFKISASALSKHLKRHAGFMSVKGLVFNYNGHYEYDANGKVKHLNEPQKRINHRKPERLIYCDQTGMTYKTQLEVCNLFQISNSQLSLHLNKRPGYRTVKGCVFRYIEPEPMQTPQPVQYPSY